MIEYDWIVGKQTISTKVKQKYPSLTNSNKSNNMRNRFFISKDWFEPNNTVLRIYLWSTLLIYSRFMSHSVVRTWPTYLLLMHVEKMEQNMMLESKTWSRIQNWPFCWWNPEFNCFSNEKNYPKDLNHTSNFSTFIKFFITW